MMAGRGDMARGGVVAVGGVLESSSSGLWWLFASRRGTAVLWMLCPVVAHLAERGLLFHTVYFHFESVTDSVMCFLTFLITQRANMCVWVCFVCIWPLSSTHCFSIFFHFSPDSSVFSKVLVSRLGLSNGFYMFHKGTPSTKHTGKIGENKVLASFPTFVTFIGQDIHS